MSNFYGAISLIGGGTGALDAIDGAALADLDGAVVLADGIAYSYRLNASSGIAEASPRIISPDVNAGDKRWVLIGGGAAPELVNRTINLDNSMSTAEIQATIDNVGRCLGTPANPFVIITFQFADGTYNLTDRLYFSGFYGGGGIRLYGNRTEANHDELHTSQQVYLDGSSFNNHVIEIEGSSVWFDILNLKIKANTGGEYYAIECAMIPNLWLPYNYLFGNSNSAGAGLHLWKCPGVVARKNYFGLAQYGIHAEVSRVASQDNDDNGAGAQPVYGLRAKQAATIGKDGTQPSGSTGNESTASGGVIR